MPYYETKAEKATNSEIKFLKVYLIEPYMYSSFENKNANITIFIVTVYI